MKLTILTTFYKNKKDLFRIYENYKKNLNNLDIKYLFVNDNFQDEVWEEIKKISTKDKNISAICFDKNYGQHAAIKSGIETISDGCVLYHDSDKIIDNSFINKGLDLMKTNQVDIVWGSPNVKNLILRNLFKLTYKLVTRRNYHYKSLFLISETTSKIVRKAYQSGEYLIGEILTSIDNRKSSLEVDFKHNNENSRYNFFSRLFLGLKHFTPYLEKIYMSVIISSFVLGTAIFFIIITLTILKLIGFANFLPGWLSIILITLFINMILIFLVCLTSLFNIEQIKSLSKNNPKIESIINKS